MKENDDISKYIVYYYKTYLNILHFYLHAKNQIFVLNTK